jgi:hypothetical protein
MALMKGTQRCVPTQADPRIRRCYEFTSGRRAILALAALLALACSQGEPPQLGPPIEIAAAGATHPTVAIDGERGIHYVA